MDANGDLPDFDTLMSMHQKDPEAFEQYRLNLLERAIAAAPPEFRPMGQHLVYRMNVARENTATPLEAALAASKLMGESFAQLQTALEHAQHETAGLQAALILQRLKG